jgi:hypothetical protein
MTQHLPAASFVVGQSPARGTRRQVPLYRPPLVRLEQVVGECRK